MPDKPKLTYTIEPTTVSHSSGPDKLSVVTVTVTARNDTSDDVACSALTASAPAGPGSGALTNDPGTVAVSPGLRTPWAVGGAGTDWVAVPLPPATRIAPGEAISVVMHDIVVNATAGTVSMSVTETTDGEHSTILQLTKSAPKLLQDAAPPDIDHFTARPVPGAATSTLSWRADRASGCVLGPPPVAMPTSGSLDVPNDGTTYTLQALGPGGRSTAGVTVGGP